MGHAKTLREQANLVSAEWTSQRDQRMAEGRPLLPAGMPLLVKIDPEADIDFVRTAFGFEILGEHEDGFLLIATDDVDLNQLEQTLARFEVNKHGGGSAAKLHSILGQSGRLDRLLSTELLQIWPRLKEELVYVIDLSVECLGLVEPPKPVERKENDSEIAWQTRQAKHDRECDRACQQWDDLRSKRFDALEELIHHYGGEVLQQWDDGGGSSLHQLPDSFSLRARVNGRGLRDVIQNYPYLFDASLPEDVDQPANAEGATADASEVQVLAPDQNSPRLCVIDSGIQQKHVWLEAAIDSAAARCFLPNEADVGDHVFPSGHGTRVAGAVLYPRGVPTEAQQAVCWIQNARVLDGQCKLPPTMYPPSLLRRVTETYVKGGTRLFLHAICSTTASRTGYMSAWAAEIDRLCSCEDVLFIQAAGNLLGKSERHSAPGVLEHLNSDRPYPAYLHESGSRIANPAQSLHALTVGSVANLDIRKDGWRTVGAEGDASAFSRCGPGMWRAVKPDVVELGGDLAVSETPPWRLAAPPAISAALPQLLRSTMHTPGPAFARDGYGTSFAAPKVAHIAACIAAELPSESALTYRALLVNSARWPSGTESLAPQQQERLLRRIGFGIPDVERATRSGPGRVTLFVSGRPRVQPREAHIYQVTLPESLRSVAASHRVFVEVTLAYAAAPRRTRRTHRSYLASWVDWKTSKLEETAESFLARVLKDDDAHASPVGEAFRWAIGDRLNSANSMPDVRRSFSTVQKDWATVRGDQLPREFCIAVVGHPGWARRLDTSVPYALCVTFDVLGEDIDIDIHAEIELTVDALRARVAV